MKGAGLWAIGIGALVGVGPLAVEPGYAGENEGKCSLATLKGLYMFAQSGYTTVSGSLVPEGVTGKDIFDGKGKFDSLATISIAGDIIPDDAAPGTYTVNPDCTGTVIVHMTPPIPDVHLDIFVAPDGSKFFTIQTDAGNVLSGTIRRVSR
jgi:hypothetical protein